jgi:hypothetical protein
MKSLLLFAIGALSFGTLSLGVGYLLWDVDALVQGGAAFALAFVPAVVTLAWVSYSCRSAREIQLLASLGASGVRMAVALGGGLLMTQLQPQRFDIPFWCWLALFYLTLLGFEISLLVRQQPKLNGSPQA